MRPSILLPFIAAAEAVLLPSPSGPYSVAMRIQPMTDNSRVDPYAPKTNQHKRKLATTLFWPVEDTKSCNITEVPYMSPATAEFYGLQAAAMGLSNDTFSELKLEVCSVSNSKACDAKPKSNGYPLAVFSPGAGNSRLFYGLLAKSLASQGYVVVTVDHPYDTNVVEFPDGSVITSANISEETGPLENLTKVRATDLGFVISTLESSSSKSLLKGLPGKIDFGKVVVWGHSLGGASAAAVMLSNPKLRGGVNMDGRLFEPALSQGLNKPFLQLGRPNHHSEDATWVEFWKHLRGPKVEGAISGAVHGSFTDLPLIVDALGVPESAKSQLGSLIGTIDAEKLSKICAEVLSSFFTLVFEGKAAPLHDTEKKMPEFSILHSNL